MAIERKLLARLGLTAEAVIEEAVNAVEAERYDGALTSLKLAIKLDGGRLSLGLASYALLSLVRPDSKADALHAFLAKELPASWEMLLAWADALYDVSNDSAGAFFERALEIAPENRTALGNYALFLDDVRCDHNRAEQLYRRVCDNDPKISKNYLGNHAKILFVLNRQDEAMDVLSKAFAAPAGEEDASFNDAVLCELHFYAYAHAWQKWPEALGQLKWLLSRGARSQGWRLDANVEQARKQGHPAPDLVAALAKVMTKQARIRTLMKFAVWMEIAPISPVES